MDKAFSVEEERKELRHLALNLKVSDSSTYDGTKTKNILI